MVTWSRTYGKGSLKQQKRKSTAANSWATRRPIELHNWCNKGCGMYCPVCGIVHITDPLLLIEKSSPHIGYSGFPFSLSILHGVDPLSYFLFQPVLHDKGCGMCYPVYGMVLIKESLLLIKKSSPCGGSRFPLSLSEWSFICLTAYNRK